MNSMEIEVMGFMICLALVFAIAIYANIQDFDKSTRICESRGLKYLGYCGAMTSCDIDVKCLNETSHQIEHYKLR